MLVQEVLESLRHDLWILRIVESAGDMRAPVQDVELVEPLDHVGYPITFSPQR